MGLILEEALIKKRKTISPKSGFSLLELSVVIGIIAVVIGASLTVGDKQVERENVRSTFNELKVIKEALENFAQRYNRLPCPASITQAKVLGGAGVEATDCDATPTIGVTHLASPAMKSGGVPYKTLGLSASLGADDWGNRYVYAVDDAAIATIAPDSTGVLRVDDRNGNPITIEASFVVFSHGVTERGGVDDETLVQNACDAGYLDTENCEAVLDATYIDSSIRETETDATYYDDLLVWGMAANIFNEAATISPDDPPETGCIAGAGMVINGIDNADRSGGSVSSAGDVNGDGYDDIIIGAYDADPNGSDSGETYIVFGKASGWSTSLDLSSLDGTNGFVLNGVAADDSSGTSVSSAGDINGDGFDDILIGAYQADPNGDRSGATYLVFGKASGWAASLNLSSLDGTNGFVLNGIVAIDKSGWRVSSGGDVNGDGFDEIVIAAPEADPNGSRTGETYIVFGKEDDWAASLDLSTLDGTNGFTLNGINVTDESGSSVSSADINGDGYSDIIIGANDGDPNGGASGETYVVFGKVSAWAATLDLSSLDGANGFTINGVAADDKSGSSVSNAGDVNNDGYDDILIGADHADPNGDRSGATYLVFGKGDWSADSGVFELSSLNGSNGFVINGIDPIDLSSYSISSSDVNGDGFDDIVVGAGWADPNSTSSGETYVVFGKASGWPSSIELSSLDGINGFVLNGIAGSLSGYSVSGAGDVNNDGFDDIVVGAPFTVSSTGGETYLLFGVSDWSTTSGVVELSALEDPAECTSTACPIALEMNLDSDAAQTAWNVTNEEGKKILVGQYDAADNNTTDTRNYALPRGNHDYTALLTDLAGDGLDTSSDALKINPSILSKAGPDDFSMCVKEFSTDSSCGITNLEPPGMDMTCGEQCEPITGVTINGIDANDSSGWAVSDAGDVNGDGYSDIIIGALSAAPNGAGSGEVYVVFGSPDGWNATLELSALDGTNGVVLNGISAGHNTGQSVSAAGDVNGDGYGDIIIGAHGASPNGSASGQTYIVFGKSSWTASLELSTYVNDINGIRINGINANDSSGWAVSSAGDVNNDGYDDVLIGAPNADPNGSDSGQSYLIFGKAAGWASFDLADLDGTIGFAINGIDAGDISGWSVSDAGDVNGDGFDDIIISASLADTIVSEEGESYVVFGKAAVWGAVFELSTLNGTNGAILRGHDSSGQSGRGVSSAGDVNGDGFDDIIIGAPSSNVNGAGSGHAYVLMGQASGWLAAHDYSDYKGVFINGAAAGDTVAWSVSDAGDVNNDGYDDVIIGSRDNVAIGESYVIFGSPGFGELGVSTLELATLDGTNGFKMNGIDAGDYTAITVSSAGDVNGDGYSDILVGAPLADPNGSISGESYLIFGSPSMFSALHNQADLAAPTALCEGCTPACSSGCSGDEYVIKACQAGTCTTIGGIPNDARCGGTGAVRCNQSCGGSFYPKIGEVCEDDSIFVGIHESAERCAYVTADSPAMSSVWQSTPTLISTVDEYGVTNHNSIAAGGHTVEATILCDNLTDHGQTDWYLPAINELSQQYIHRIDIGGYTTSAPYWSSSAIEAGTASLIGFTDAGGGVPFTNLKTNSHALRCMRIDEDDAVTCSQSCGGTISPSPGATCDDGSTFVGIHESVNRCAYVTTTNPAISVADWQSSPTTTGAESTIFGFSNQALINYGGHTVEAVEVCENASDHGRNDWWLPASEELENMYPDRMDIGGFTDAAAYMTSTEADASNVLHVSFAAVGGTAFSTLKTNSGAVRCMRTDPKVLGACDQTCGGSTTPNPGDVCTDGSVYAGRSPDGDDCMYVTAADAGSGTWADNNYLIGVRSDDTGAHNTTVLAVMPGFLGNWPAAEDCNAMTTAGHSDWYLPAHRELKVIADNQAAIGGFSAVPYLSSTESDATRAKAIDFTDGSVTTPLKSASVAIRCARKDNPVTGCAVRCGGSYTPTPGDDCDDGSVFAGISPDEGRCMYTTNGVVEFVGTWSADSVVTGASDHFSGKENTAILDASPTTDPAAESCIDRTSHGKTDWFLPATNELWALYQFRTAIGGFSDAEYWSSTEGSSTTALEMDFEFGTQAWLNKSTVNAVRCVRTDAEGAGSGGGGGSGTVHLISAGGQHSCGINTFTDRALCWGAGDKGQLGNGDTSNQPEPVLVQDGDATGGYTQISAGFEHSCGIGLDKRAYCWGRNDEGQLGDGSFDTIGEPQLVANGESLGTFKQISAGMFHTCAIGTDDKAYCWGKGDDGQLGSNETGSVLHNTPVLVHNGASLGTFKQISAGNTHTCAIGSEGIGYCWGDAIDGKLGNGASLANEPEPVLVLNGEGPGKYAEIRLGLGHSCGLGIDEKIYCWGNGAVGQLGNGANDEQVFPVLVVRGAIPDPIPLFSQIEVGGEHSCGILKTGTNVYCWGNQANFRLGNNSNLGSVNEPVLVEDGESDGTYEQISAGLLHTCGRSNISLIKTCWGEGSSGQIGNNDGSPAPTPQRVHTGEGY